MCVHERSFVLPICLHCRPDCSIFSIILNVFIGGSVLAVSPYPQHIPIFTDGSKQSNHTATAVVLKSHNIAKRLPNSVSVYTDELYAIF